jgi:RNA polymerase sigma factor (sigma-70 family)
MVHTIRNRVLCLLARASWHDADQTDGHLLRRFVHHHDESAFEALLRRHGGMVWGVCRRSLGHEQDAEDVFQATFLVLARQAARVRKPEALASWLHGTARRLAHRAKRDLSRRHNYEQRARMTTVSGACSEIALRELQELLDHEVERLPVKYREVFMRCVLSGQTKEEIATALGCDPGTVSVHLCRARKRLQQQLARRGMVFPAALTAAALTQTGASATPAHLIGSALLALGKPLSALPEHVAGLLIDGGSAAIGWTKQKVFAIALLSCTLLAAGAWAFTSQGTPRVSQAASLMEPPRLGDAPVAARKDEEDKPPKYFIRLVKTDLQRALAPMQTDVYVLLDGDPALVDGKIIMGNLNLEELWKALAKHKKADTKLHLTLFFQHIDSDADHVKDQEMLRLAMIGFAHWRGFSKVSAFVSTGPATLDWKKAASPFTNKVREPDDEVPGTTNKLAKAYPVRSDLSRYLTSGADCAVLILPSLEEEGGTLPQKVRDAVTDVVGKVKLARKKRVLFVLKHVMNVKDRQPLINALGEFAKEIGFEENEVTFR